jgi:hypothetical protein
MYYKLMREGLKTDELIALIIAVIGIFIYPFMAADQVIMANSIVTVLPTFGWLAVAYLFICIAARKFDDIQRKYHQKSEPKATGSSKRV